MTENNGKSVTKIKKPLVTKKQMAIINGLGKATETRRQTRSRARKRTRRVLSELTLIAEHCPSAIDDSDLLVLVKTRLEHGPLGDEWELAILQAIKAYLKQPKFRIAIDERIRKGLPPSETRQLRREKAEYIVKQTAAVKLYGQKSKEVEHWSCLIKGVDETLAAFRGKKVVQIGALREKSGAPLMKELRQMTSFCFQAVELLHASIKDASSFGCSPSTTNKLQPITIISRDGKSLQYSTLYYPRLIAAQELSISDAVKKMGIDPVSGGMSERAVVWLF